jgi:outer membrane receptor protein involved in Fe transport
MRVLALCIFLALPLYAEPEEPPQAPAPIEYSETIEVTASRVEQPLLNAPVAVSIIDRQQIETSPAQNYADLLRGVPGLNAIQTSTSDISVRARGGTKLTENTQLVLIDGRSIYLDYYGFVIWDYLPVTLDELEAIDVVHGPGSSVWGANAMSGVINLRTRSPRDLAGGLATLTIGEQGSRGATLRWADVLGPWSYKVSTAYFQQDPWPRDNLLPDGSPVPFGYTYENQGTRQPKLDLRVDRELGESSTLSIRGGSAGTQGLFHSSIGPFAVQEGAHTDYVEVDYSRGALEAKAYWNHLDGDAPNVLNGINFSFETHTSVVEASHRRLLGTRQMLVYGATFRDNQFDLSLAPNHSSRRDSGLFVEDIVNVSDRLELNLGVRADHFATLGTVVSPRLSAIFKPTENQAVRFAANRAYRAPTLAENYLDTVVPNVVFLDATTPFFFFSHAAGNIELEEESLDALEVGWSWQRGPLFLSASVYRNEIDNNVVFLPVTFYSGQDPPPNWPGQPGTVPPFALIKSFTFLNVGSVRNSGVELSSNMRFSGGLRARIAYAHQRAPEVRSELEGVPFTVNRPPRHVASASIDRSGDRWFGSASLSYTSRAVWNDILDPRFWGSTPSYTLLGGSFGVNVLPKTQLVVSGTNLLDREVKQHVFGDVIGRKVSIEVRQRF